MKKSKKILIFISLVLMTGIIVFASLFSSVQITKNINGALQESKSLGYEVITDENGNKTGKAKYIYGKKEGKDYDDSYVYTGTAKDIIKSTVKYALPDSSGNYVRYKWGAKAGRKAYTTTPSSTAHTYLYAQPGSGYDSYGTDCSGLIFGALVDEGIKLNNYCAAEQSQVPIDTAHWIVEPTNSKSNVERYDAEGNIIPKGDTTTEVAYIKFAKDPYVYNVKWINGNEISRIVTYQQKHNSYTDTEGNQFTLTSYADFIEKNKVTKGSVIVAINPKRYDGDSSTSGANHAWMYIGKYSSTDSLKSYLKGLGFSDDDVEKIRYDVRTDESGNLTSQYWSIESRDTINGIDGPTITNRDPAESMESDKGGNGYAAFTLVDDVEESGSYSLNIEKQSILGTSLADAKFSIEQIKNQDSNNVKQTTVVTSADSKSNIVFGESEFIEIDDVEHYDEYKITESSAPNGYSISKIGENDYIKVRLYKNTDYTISKATVIVGENEIEPSENESNIYIDKDGNKVTSEDSYVFALSVNSESKLISFVWRDTKDSNYNMKIYKQSSSNLLWNEGNGIAGAIFEVKQFINKETDQEADSTKNVETIYSLATDIVFDNKTYNDDNGNILLNETTAGTHTYEIKELSAPSGYVLPEFFANGGKIRLALTTELSAESGNYEISQMAISKVSSTVTDLGVIKKGEAYADDLVKVKLSKDGQIAIGVKDTAKSGEYKMELMKESVKGMNTEKAQYIDSEKAKALKNARFRIKKTEVESRDLEYYKTYWNYSEYYRSVVTNENDVVSMTDSEYVQITSAETMDVYFIKEALQPQGYNLSSKVYIVEVVKEEQEDSFNVKDVNVLVGDLVDDEITNISEISKKIGNNDDGSKYLVYLSDDKETEFRLDYSNNRVIFSQVDEPVNQYYMMKIRKVEEETETPLSNVKFTVEKRINSLSSTDYEEIVSSQNTDKDGYVTFVNLTEMKLEENTAFTFYTIKEVDIGNNNVIKLKNDIQIVTNIAWNYEINRYELNAKFIDGTTSKEVELEDGTTVTIEINIEDSEISLEDGTKATAKLVTLTIPNKNVKEGKYGLTIKKVNASENDKPVGGVKFKVSGNQINGGEKEITTPITGSSTGETTVLLNVEINEENVNTPDEYTVEEVDLGENELLKLADPLKIKVNKTYDETKKAYTVESVTFEDGSNTKQVNLQGGETATATVNNEGGLITLTIPNKNIKEGKYGLTIKKVNASENDKPVGGVKFKVSGNQINGGEKEITTPITGSSTGETTVLLNVEINEENVNTPDEYTVEEVDLGENELLKLADPLKIKVNKTYDETKKAYTVESVTFEDGSNTKQVNLQGGKTATATVNNEGGLITLTIPNKEIEGSFDLKVIKKDSKTSEKISGAGFKVKILDEEGNLLENASELGIDGTKELFVNNDEASELYGTLNISGLKIAEKGKTYTINITESTVPKNYLGAEEKTITATSVYNETSNKYELVPDNTQDSVLIENELITAEIKNTQIIEENGKYKLNILKVDSENENIKLQGVKFTVNSTETESTSEEGIVNIANKDITKEGTDTYQITEVNLGNNKYLKMQDTLTVNVKTTSTVTENVKKYIVESYSFDDNSTTK